MIGIDWGTTSFRAYILGPGGQIREKIENDRGIFNCAGRQFGEVLKEQLALFQRKTAGLPIIASGMITSRQGWRETPYLECPCTAGQLAEQLCRLDFDRSNGLWFVPGVKQLGEEPDIMRGEETQLMGLAGDNSQTCLLPGTHSKWVAVQKGTIRGFTTFMTGDLFEAVLSQTILRATALGKWSDEDFITGVNTGYRRAESGRSLLSGLFQVRVADILGLDPELDKRSLLSGILVGSEIGEASLSYGLEPVLVIGNERLSRLYLLALAACGLKAEKGPEDASAMGLWRMAQIKNLM
jgi:2-dehydro-3-deoxygalactonokinase